MSESSPPGKHSERQIFRTEVYMEKGYCIIKEVNELRKADAPNAGGGDRRGKGMVRETPTGNCSHSSMSEVVRRCPPHGNNCKRRTSSPGGHWSLADGWAETCPFTSSPELSEWRTHLSAWWSLKILPKPVSSVLLKTGVLNEGVQRPNKVWGKLHAASCSWRFTRHTACGRLSEMLHKETRLIF